MADGEVEVFVVPRFAWSKSILPPDTATGPACDELSGVSVSYCIAGFIASDFGTAVGSATMSPTLSAPPAASTTFYLSSSGKFVSASGFVLSVFARVSESNVPALLAVTTAKESDVIVLAFLSVKLVNVFALIASALVVANVSDTFDVTAMAFLSTMLETVSPVSCGAIDWSSDELTPGQALWFANWFAAKSFAVLSSSVKEAQPEFKADAIT